ncbi:LytR C-terminal domain-containing protein [Actinoalloteichus hymeniacidonis]|uniref:LytR cell envelope-related transcriptional attenuator n=1 Tax=Actinoalloteichus hymeniacidonis TaxID=340345 RepID=A0AAC9MWG2_9PSEU|nr:LytR C-terminal domain-containing protein [Actinoalloteichus hymeniacidonis]AOS61245.1 LytR cell envelope-related transcriptional attenuator [Actinoalloteichus hymeniacidonis]MBB5910752.1 hypothetical protein [Actinoalloteichus hymeniacidonis]
MSSVEPSGSARPLRGVAFGMFGLAAIALVFGVMSLTSGGNSMAEQNAGGSSSTAPPPSEDSAGGADNGESDQGGSDAEESEGSAGTEDGGDSEEQSDSENGDAGSGGSDGSDGAGSDSASTETPLRIFNNSTVRGLAADAADDFEAAGWEVAEVANYSAGVITTTTAYYRPGTPEEQAAGEIGSAFGIRVEPRFDGIADLGPGVVLLIASDYGTTEVDPK